MEWLIDLLHDVLNYFITFCAVKMSDNICAKSTSRLRLWLLIENFRIHFHFQYYNYSVENDERIISQCFFSSFTCFKIFWYNAIEHWKYEWSEENCFPLEICENNLLFIFPRLCKYWMLIEFTTCIERWTSFEPFKRSHVSFCCFSRRIFIVEFGEEMANHNDEMVQKWGSFYNKHEL